MVQTIELKFTLQKLKKVILKWFQLKNDQVIDVMVAVYIANRLASDPLWLIIIGPPSSTKTELLRSFEDHKNTYFISNLTPSTLVSGIKPKKNSSDPSLLPRLNDKLVVLKDFTSVLSMRSENQQEILSVFREAHDGQYSKAFGNGKELHWSGRFGLIGACTPVYDAHYGVIGSMGERFLLYRTENFDDGKMGLQAQRIVGQEDQMRSEIRDAVHRFIDQFDVIKTANFKENEDVNHMIAALASFVAYGRCPVERDYRSQYIKYQPLPEGTPRLNKQFRLIGIGLAMAYGKNEIDLPIYEIIKKVGRDLIPVQRLKIIEHLWNERAVEFLDGWRKTKAIADAVNMPMATVRLILEDLMVVDALNRDLENDGEKSPYLWQISQPVSERIGQAEIFETAK